MHISNDFEKMNFIYHGILALKIKDLRSENEFQNILLS